MRKTIVVALSVLAVPTGLAVAQSTGLKVTGGGQVVASSDTSNGPGDTIAFNAQQTAPADATSGIAAAKGQLQVVQHVTGGVKAHGDVTCITTFTPSSGDNKGQRFVRFGGYEQVKGKSTTVPFTVDVQDNGEQGTDLIYFRQRSTGDNPCDNSDQSTDLRSATLARGNVTEH